MGDHRKLGSIDVLVVPSIGLESPLVIQEVFLAGVPVVASRIGGIQRWSTMDGTGCLRRVMWTILPELRYA
jgi:hypothetical protein